MPANDPKPIIITITVLPFAKGKRRLIVSGAPQGEMPVVHAGDFSQVHPMFNAVWTELIKRKPQVPKLDKEKPAVASAPAQITPADPEGDAPEGDQLVASATSIDAGAGLPAIEDVAGVNTPAVSAPLLSSIDETETEAEAESEPEEDTNG